jgi:hypothetical protein
MSASTVSVQGRKLLVDLLREAARLEHCLLDSYLYAACSLKSVPQEFSKLGDVENRRRAIQFERVRAWKKTVLEVAHEEMLHLHYVQCMLRALGERPEFSLPARDKEGQWIIPNWDPRVGNEPGRNGVQVPVAPLDATNIRRFVLFESADSLQNENIFGPQATELFDALYQFEFELHCESILYDVSDDRRRSSLKESLLKLFRITPFDRPPVQALMAIEERAGLPELADLRFQSIADLYKNGILPLFEQAFHFGWVKYADLDLMNEMLDPQHAAQGFLPVGPVFRSPRFSHIFKQNISDALRHYKNIKDVISEIVDEGEGFAGFRRAAEEMLGRIKEITPRGYLLALQKSAQLPEWIVKAQQLRLSHLYRFAMIMTEMNVEQGYAHEVNADFSAFRDPLNLEAYQELRDLADEIPKQFNACYLVTTAWLSRMYEIQTWTSDTPRRLAIEMLASWPLMSIAIRPFLELASFFPIDRKNLFRAEANYLPMLPLDAQELLELVSGKERTQEINDRIDYFALRTLTAVAEWAGRRHDDVSGSKISRPYKEMILQRFQALQRLSEFEKQFPFRIHGGYSNQLPDLAFQRASFTESSKYAENPAAIIPLPWNPQDQSPDQPPLYKDSLVLRLRFAGFGLVQLATDPDPPTDESGCTGTLMLRAADGDLWLDRALVWQAGDKSILRAPREALPPIGVKCVDATLCVTDGEAQAGFVPIGQMNSSGAVQASGVQQDLQITGLLEVIQLPFPSPALSVVLRDRNSERPHLEGLNHLVWQDGEPIDPFIISIFHPSDLSKPAMQREVFNEGRSLLYMDPLQRIMSSRAPCGFDSVTNIPAWAMPNMIQEALADPTFPIGYLKRRAAALADLFESLSREEGKSQSWVDQCLSVAERMLLVSLPRVTTVKWLPIALHYGHTVSGKMDAMSAEMSALIKGATRMGTELSSVSDRMKPNSRWVAKYTKGFMDTDALSDFIYGELYIPLVVTDSGKISLTHAWRMPGDLTAYIRSRTLRFDQPFWDAYSVTGQSRTTTFGETTITERLIGTSESSYRYVIEGLTGVQEGEGVIGVEDQNGECVLQLGFEGSCDASSVVTLSKFFANTVSDMGDGLSGLLSLK